MSPAPSGRKVRRLHLRHLHPMPNGLERIFDGFDQVVVVEMNDEGLYGYGQLATLLRARYCDPKILSLTKTDGLTFSVREIIAGIERVIAAAAEAYAEPNFQHCLPPPST